MAEPAVSDPMIRLYPDILPDSAHPFCLDCPTTARFYLALLGPVRFRLYLPDPARF